MKQIGNLLVVIRASTDQFKKELNSAQSQVKKFASEMKSAGRALTTSITLPFVAVGGYALKMATDVMEAENLFKVAMGDMADDAFEWSNALAKALQLNQYNIRKNLGTFQLMLESMGVAKEAAYGMSKNLTKLAIDMASLRNIGLDEAITKIQSGLVGMPRPLQNLGIVINEATVKTWALTNGLIKQGEQMTEVQKILARYGALLEATTKDTNDFANTIESPANQLRILKEQIELVATDLGIALMPAFLKILKIIRSGIDIVKVFVAKFQALSEGTKNIIIAIAGFAAVLGPALMAIGLLADGVGALFVGFKMLLSPAGLITAAFMLLSGTLIYLYTTNENVKTGLDSAWKSLSASIPNSVNKIERSLIGLKTTFYEKVLRPISEWMWRLSGLDEEYIAKTLKEWDDKIKKDVEEIESFVPLKTENMKGIGESLEEFFKGLKIDLPGIDMEQTQQDITDIMSEIEEAFKQAGGTVTTTVDDMTNAIKSLIDAVKQQAKSFMDFVGMFDIFERKYVSGERLLRRMKAHVQVMKEWQTSLAQLQSRGIDASFINELRSMGPGSVDSTKALLGLSQEKLLEYVGLWRQQSGIAGTEASAQVGYERSVETYIASQVNLNITGNKISNNEDVDRIANQIISKLRLAGVSI